MIDQILLLLAFTLPMLGMAKSSGGGKGMDMSILRDEVEAEDDTPMQVWAGFIKDEEVQKRLSEVRIAWERWKEEIGHVKPFENTMRYKRIIEKHSTLAATEAIRSDNKWALTKYITSSAESARLRDLKMTKWLIKDINREPDDPYLKYLAGNMGRGKTDFALLIAEIWMWVTGGVILTNIESCEHAVYVSGQNALDEWLDENPNQEFIFVFDEASDTADSRGDTTAVNQQLSPFLKYIRKKDGNMIIIGHTGKDVAAEVRRLCEFIQKESKKVATFYKTVEDGEGQDLQKKIRGIPPTSLDFDTNEDTEWAWSDDLLQRCLGTNSEGNWCGTEFDTNNGRVLCSKHSHQEEPHPNVPPKLLESTKFEEFIEESEDYDDEEDEEPPALPPAPEVQPELAEQVRKEAAREAEEEAAQESTESSREDAEDEEIEDENPTPQNTADDSRGRDEQDESSEETTDDEDLLEQVPDEYWEKVTERTGYTREDIDEFEKLEQLLGDRDYQRLKSKLDA